MAVMICAVALFTAAILAAAGAPPTAAFVQILKGSLGSWSKFGHVIKAWIPLTLCAAGLLFTFRIGLWNIGIEGQVILGAVMTTAVMRAGTASLDADLVLIMAFAAGAAGGALWAIAAGLLKTHGGVHEIFAGLGLNFVAQGLALWLIFGPWKRPGVASMSGTEVFPRSLWLFQFTGLRISPVGLALAVGAIVVTAMVLGRSRMGLNLRAIGSNPRAAVLFGLRPSRFMVLAMAFAGCLAGLAGSVQVAGVYHRLIPSISSNYGYLALLVVMLANYNVWAVAPIALFFACLNVGSIQLPMVLRLDSSLSGVIQGALVLATLAVQAWRAHKRRQGRIGGLAD
ncbi:MAG: ABC transporter permease [Desulfobacterales bacterium]|nr:ABC transporter permease [Desulfobacterales bacterium]